MSLRVILSVLTALQTRLQCENISVMVMSPAAQRDPAHAKKTLCTVWLSIHTGRSTECAAAACLYHLGTSWAEVI